MNKIIFFHENNSGITICMGGCCQFSAPFPLVPDSMKESYVTSS